MTYGYEDANVTEVKENAALVIKEMEGRHQTSSVRLSLRRDTRDVIINTTKGSANTVSVEYAGGPSGRDQLFYPVPGQFGLVFPFLLGDDLFCLRQMGVYHPE